MRKPELPNFKHAKDSERRTGISRKEARTLEAIAEHSEIIEELRLALGFNDPKTAMSWVFEQLEESEDLKYAIFKLLEG
mgnify:CR=1 FL=1